MKGVVVDASLTIGSLLQEEETGLALVEQAIKEGLKLLVPTLFWYEVANALFVAVRRGRLGEAEAYRALSALRALDFQEENPPPTACLETALETGLSVYDAAYLWLAEKTGSPLWTLDGRLSEQARSRGVPCRP